MENNIQIKCFVSDNEIILEDQVNKWILKNKIDIVDIKFSSSSWIDNIKIYYDYSVIIIYKSE